VSPGVGDAVPDFALVNQFGEPVGSATLGQSDYLLVFYPFAFSRVCTSELRDLERLRPGFEAEGVRILGASVDHKYALRAYAAELGVTFDLLADFWPHGEAAEAFGCFDEGHGRALRSSFLVSGGRIAAVFTSPVGEARNPEEYRAAVVRLRGEAG
jgi:mycoredoxin-dependent peroxiredoxin